MELRAQEPRFHDALPTPCDRHIIMEEPCVGNTTDSSGLVYMCSHGGQINEMNQSPGLMAAVINFLFNYVQVLDRMSKRPMCSLSAYHK